MTNSQFFQGTLSCLTDFAIPYLAPTSIVSCPYFGWKSISCAPEVRFRDESQLREYFLDYLFIDLNDAGSPLLLECECYRDGTSTGFADYMVKMNGRWVPVEAKLHLGAPPNVLSQATKYQNIQIFSPRLGNHRGTQFKTDASPGCLLADPSGVYALRGNQFFHSSPTQPIIYRQDLETTNFEALLSTIKSLFKTRSQASCIEQVPLIIPMSALSKIANTLKLGFVSGSNAVQPRVQPENIQTPLRCQSQNLNKKIQ